MNAPEQRLDPSIQIAIVKAEDALSHLAEVVASARKRCTHPRVAECPWQDAGLPAMRICLSCGEEEHGSHWSEGAVWSRQNYKKEVLGNVPGRDILKCTRDAFYTFRIPHIPLGDVGNRYEE